MLDGEVRKLIDPALERIGARLAAAGVSADSVTVAGGAIGLAAAAAIAFQFYLAGLALLLASRLCDGLDGAIARATKPSDYGGYLDIVLDFVFYGAIPLGFIIANPAANAVAGGVLIFSFYINGSTFLAFAILAERHDMISNSRGDKSLYFTTGLAEGTETIAVFSAFCLFPGIFPILAYVFAAVCFYTALSRIVLAGRQFGRR
ncbi:CDP-alcohol phosphatidyltransferase family protein [Hoeflea sp. WL0058]|uniref:CDP-alcohol phosphatidyltransferase family protein n=1 Tax=Flavimaribacter sediminis TaxID=2865987 RepID=A0AAE2ZJ72_9HYPH|nr:CDP-alcohol phosphatidyltransferase family protein [Flavimaribacter sediminis]MBW8637729.1 CDP-alcohol phosphatidyltransferase family protein [Flavimaribacter sediminis]